MGDAASSSLCLANDAGFEELLDLGGNWRVLHVLPQRRGILKGRMGLG